jgi:hypothetical protein
MQVIPAILSGFGLSASAGLNAYIPLLMVSLGAEFFPDLIQLPSSFKFMTEPWFIALLVVMLVVEVLADKVPVIDHMNDVIGTVVRPAAGALLFAASTGAVTHIDPKLAAAAGLIVAGSTHAAKATARPIVTATTAGIGNPVISTLEDVAALITSLVAILAPLLIGVAVLIFAALFGAWVLRRDKPAGTELTPTD